MAGRGPRSGGRGGDPLAEYRRKRSADATPEPFSSEADQRSGMFVVQKHAASRTHYDFRLEHGGVLLSWAVPKGPSLDPDVKRLAVETEPHPVEYADFEGIIPEGNYGAGAVITWDRGRWEAVKDPAAGLDRGKLLFDLYGYKLRGRWTLFRTGKDPASKEWLLVKKPDAEASVDKSLPEGSVRSGLTVEQLRDGDSPVDTVVERLGKLDVRRGTIDLARFSPMLAKTADAPFSRPGWLFELKYDGYRLVAGKRGDGVFLRYRRGGDATAMFPEIAEALGRLPLDDVLVDGEVVVLDETGRPSFQLLQGRARLSRAADVRRATIERPATLVLFDLLALQGFDLRRTPLHERKEALRALLPPAGALKYCDHIEEHGEAMYEGVVGMRLEGVVAKDAGSTYVSRRSDAWLKVRADRTGDFAIVGMSPAKGSRAGFGALHLAERRGEGWSYVGRVGSGFDDAELDALARELEPSVADAPVFDGPAPGGDGHRWVEPERVCEVRYKERTREGHLRHPVFLRMRDDKAPEDCLAEDDAALPEEPPAPVELEEERDEKNVAFTNLDKVFWPAEGYTKGDLIDYHRAVADRILPYLRDRPVVLTRYPDGIDGKSFFQKDAPAFAPNWIRIETMWSEHTEREIRYFIADDEPSLLYLANMGTIPLHLWSSRVEALQHPDWCILDLDPKDAPFEDVITIAKRFRTLCDGIGLPSFVKTSGSSGLHILLPLGGQCTYEQSRALGEVLARIVARELPEIATTERSMAARKGRVYLDYLQNGHGRLLVAPFCVRPLPGAPVSTPLKWSEVRKGLDIRKHTITTVPRRMRRLGEDPLLDVLTGAPDLPAVLGRLAEELE